MSTDTTKPIHGYWAIRGLGNPIRFLLAYTNTDYEDKRYECGDAPDYDRSCWLNEKFKLGLELPNLPYWIEPNGFSLTESNAILRYLAKKHGLAGKDDKKAATIDMWGDHAADFSRGMTRLFYGGNFEEEKKKFIAGLPGNLEKYEKKLGDKKFLCGELSWADFRFYELWKQLTFFSPESFEKCPKIKAYLARFEALPGIAEYLKSDKYIERPCNNKMANWK